MEPSGLSRCWLLSFIRIQFEVVIRQAGQHDLVALLVGEMSFETSWRPHLVETAAPCEICVSGEPQPTLAREGIFSRVVGNHLVTLRWE